MYEIGRLCVKIAGRDASKKCLIVDVLDSVFVLVDGQTRRRKCNILHIEPLDRVIKIKKGASHSDVVEALKKEGIEVVETKPKEKKEKPKRLETKKEAAEPKEKKAKPAKEKKAEPDANAETATKKVSKPKAEKKPKAAKE